MGTQELPLELRREVFRALVAAQDGGLGPAESCKAVAAAFGVDEGQVRAISDEGVDKQWPPLDDA
jgi:hypothetical protein